MIDYNKLSYAEFLLISNAIVFDDIKKLQRENYGLRQKVKNRDEKLYKRDEQFKGAVHDCQIGKRAKR